MALGFKKSLFGYKCEDVTEYISKTVAQHKDTVLSLKEKLNNEEQNLIKAKSDIEKLKEDLAALNVLLDFYKSKYDEIKGLSDNIGKLYLVAQTNAKAIISAADSAQNSSKLEIERNINVLNSANESLKAVRERMNLLNIDFSDQVNSLCDDLEDIRKLASSAEQTRASGVDSFEKTFKSITE